MLVTNPPLDHLWMILNGLSHIGPVTVDKLIATYHGDITKIFEATVQELQQIDGVGKLGASKIVHWRDNFNLDREIERLQQLNGAFIHKDSLEYSTLLKEIYDPPTGLYFLGKCRPNNKTIGIVGSRRCTLYGMAVAKKLAADLARMGFCIVSGLARGIDAAAHQGALEAGGETVAVLGCGVDCIYPPENKDLYHQIQKQGAVVSEFTLGRKADKMTFPRRNRIVSGLSQALIVVETNSNGGSMITARMANEQGRHVFAVPGRIDQVSSKGCNELIRDGATLITSAEDVLEEISYLKQTQGEFDFAPTHHQSINPKSLDLQGLEKELYITLKESGLAGIDQLANLLQKPTQEVSSGLLMLELKQLVVKRADGNFEAK